MSCGGCFDCLCNHCANNVDGDHTWDEMEYLCYNCDEERRWVGKCEFYKPTQKHIEQQAEKRRKNFKVLQGGK